MTTANGTPGTNGHTAPQAATYNTPIPDGLTTNTTGGDLPEFMDNAPSVTELRTARDYASQVIQEQDDPQLTSWKSEAEFQQELRVAQQHREAMLKITEKGNGKTESRATRAQEVDDEIERTANEDRLQANRAQNHLKRLTDPVSYLATQMRYRKLALTLVTIPAVLGVVIGGVNVQYAIGTGLLGLAWTSPFAIALLFLELLVSAPLIGIMLLEMSDPDVENMTIGEMFTDRFFLVKAGLLIASATYSVVPHIGLDQPVLATLCLGIPASIVVSMAMIPAVNSEFNERIRNAKTEAQKGAPVGNLTSDQSRLLRQVAIVQHADVTGQLTGERDSDGVPSTNSTLRAIKAAQGTASKPNAMEVTTALRVLNGHELDSGATGE